jgi:hypothetical protein
LEREGMQVHQRPLLDHTLQLRVDPEDPPPVALRTATGLRLKEWLASHSHLYTLAGRALRGSVLHPLLAELGLMRPPREHTVERIIGICQGCFGQALWGLEATLDPRRRVRALTLFSRMLSAMSEWCNEREVPFLVLLIPTRLEVRSDCAGVAEATRLLAFPVDARAALDALRLEIVHDLQGKAIDFLDLAPSGAHAAAHAELFLEKDWHLNAAGHRWIAAELASTIEASGWFPLED